MAKILSPFGSSFFFFVVVFFFPFVFSQQITKKDIGWWCRSTPHPVACNRFMGSGRSTMSDPESDHRFGTLTIRAAMERAVHAKGRAEKQLSHHHHHHKPSPKWKTLIRDCNDLIDHTITQLNATLQSMETNTTNYFDVLTWLSAALTNVELCRSAPLELNVTKFRSPILTAQVAEMISNSLSVNWAVMSNSSTASVGGYPRPGNEYNGVDGFPRWVTGGDRKLLQGRVKPTVVVALDGSGQFRSVQEGIEYAISNRVGDGRVVVHVKKGVYEENLLINRTMSKVMLVGDGVRYTIITGSRSSSDGFTTYGSATVGVDGAGFIARGITFRNTAGPQGGQAVALRSASDLSVFYACSFEGYQDTLFVHAQRQFYKSCYIYGTIDFIFGNAAVVLQNCVIYVRKPLEGQANSVTAQGRGDPFQNTGISIHNCRILPAPDLKPVVGSFKTYLGRPWQEHSRTVVMKSYLDEFVTPEGWSRWGDSDFALSTLYYGEYQNFGPGSSLDNRVKWPGFHVINSSIEASRFTVTGLLAGRTWLPATGVPFIAGV